MQELLLTWKGTAKDVGALYDSLHTAIPAVTGISTFGPDRPILIRVLDEATQNDLQTIQALVATFTPPPQPPPPTIPEILASLQAQIASIQAQIDALLGKV